jgi:subtilisin family serine protease
MSIIQPNNRLIVLSDDNGNFISTPDFTRKLKDTIQELKLPNLQFENLSFEVSRLHDPRYDAQRYGADLMKMPTQEVEKLFEGTVYNNPNSEMSELKKRLYRYFIVTVKNNTQGRLLHRLFNKADAFLPYIEQAWFDQIAYTPTQPETQAIEPPKAGKLLQARAAPPPITCPTNWNMDMIGRTGLTGLLGDNVVVAVLDGGIRTNHKCFSDIIGLNQVWADANGTKGVLLAGSNLSAATAHGTQTAALAVGKYGVASRAIIMNVKITQTLNAYVSTIAQAIHICTDYNVRIINISYTVPQDVRNNLFYPAHDQIEYAAVEHNGIIVFSAGNDNVDARLNVPPNAPQHCIIVGGFGCDGALWRESATSGTNTGDAVTLTAPAGSSQTATQASNTAVGTFSGTSAAAPHVAGLIAIMLSRNPALTLAEIKGILRANTTGGAITRVNVAQVMSHLPPP